MNIVVFEDAGVSQLFPVTIGRPAFTITCATFTLLDWLPLFGSSVRTVVRPHLRAIETLDRPQATDKLNPDNEWTLAINARMVPSVENFQKVKSLLNRHEVCVVKCDEWSNSAALIPTNQLEDSSDEALFVSIEKLCSDPATVEVDLDLPLFVYPHDIVRFNLSTFKENIEYRVQKDGERYQEIADGVFVGGDVTISDFVVTNTHNGPIIIEDGSMIGPFCFLRGPIYIGPNCRINEHAAIKDEVSIAHTIKIGGEIEGSVIEAYSNKQHHGFLGHSYLGSWINLGAGTCNSDLKNTYGEVNMVYGGERVSTGMQFVGCIMGDYAKTAINTSIFTGKLIGAGSMLYGFVTTNVPSFTNYARSFGQVTESPPGILELTQKRMFARRNVPQRPEDIQLIYDMYELTRSERQISEEPLNL